MDCFDPDYESELPVHPDRAFTGRAQMRKNWAQIFKAVPDIQATLLHWTVEGDNPISFVPVYDIAWFVELAVTDPAMRGVIVEVGVPNNLSMRQVHSLVSLLWHPQIENRHNQLCANRPIREQLQYSTDKDGECPHDDRSAL